MVHPDLAALVESAAIDGDRRYTVLGEVREDVGANGVPPVLADFATLDAYRRDASEEANVLIPFLAAEIYGRLYCRALSASSGASDLLTQRDFIGALSSANAGTGGWDPGWRTAGLDGDRVAVVRGDVTFWAERDQVRVDTESLAADQPCSVRVKKEFRHFVTGFYMALGDTWRGTGDPTRQLVRVYWNLTSRAAAWFIGLTTGMLNKAAIPFRAKVLSDPALFVRADAGVLYVDREDFGACLPLLRRIATELNPHLRAHPPRLTKKLWPGVGLAEDPPRDSFGLARSKLLACALWSCYRNGFTDPPRRIAHVVEYFDAMGVDPERPYLEQGGDDRYSVDGHDDGSGDGTARAAARSTTAGRPRIAVDEPEVAAPARPDCDLARVARETVRQLSRSAVWSTDGTRCNWIGRRDKDDAVYGSSTCAGAVGPDLYAGSTGVALFLTEAARCSLDTDAAHVAAGALRRSERLFRSGRGEPSISPVSFFAGHLGIAYVASRLMQVAPSVDLGEELEWLMMQVRAATASDPPFDLIAGCAGAIPPLLLLAAEPGLEYCEGLAIRCGERLCATAAWEDGQCAWSPSPGAAAGTPLTGMSHGATGPARALLELHARTGHAPFLRTARGAFAYEDSFYSPAAENWVDTRSPYSGEPGNRTGRCISAWCHGAPGIALARARAAILDVEMAERHSATVRRAASTIFATLDARLADDDGDATLCHGTAGLSEIALTLGGLMSDGEWEERAIAAAHELAANHDPESYWPSGVSAGGPNPTLMIGASGVGHHFLRVAFPDKVPSVLLLSP